MKKNTAPIWGIALVVLGIFVALRAFGLFDVNFMFWVSLMVLIPCFIGFCSNKKNRLGYLIGIVVGAMFMLISFGIFRWRMFGPLCLAAVFLMIGIKMITDSKKDNTGYDGQKMQGTDYTEQSHESASYASYGENATESAQSAAGEAQSEASQTSGFNNAENNTYTGYSNTSGNSYTGTNNGYQGYSAVLSGRVINFDNEVFEGAMLSSVMGSVQLNLKNAIITHDVNVDAKCTLAGIDIFVPRNVKVVLSGTPVLGGITNKTINPAGMINCPTIFINASCVLGGIEVKY